MQSQNSQVSIGAATPQVVAPPSVNNYVTELFQQFENEEPSECDLDFDSSTVSLSSLTAPTETCVPTYVYECPYRHLGTIISHKGKPPRIIYEFHQYLNVTLLILSQNVIGTISHDCNDRFVAHTRVGPVLLGPRHASLVLSQSVGEHSMVFQDEIIYDIHRFEVEYQGLLTDHRILNCVDCHPDRSHLYTMCPIERDRRFADPQWLKYNLTGDMSTDMAIMGLGDTFQSLVEDQKNKIHDDLVREFRKYSGSISKQFRQTIANLSSDVITAYLVYTLEDQKAVLLIITSYILKYMGTNDNLFEMMYEMISNLLSNKDISWIPDVQPTEEPEPSPEKAEFQSLTIDHIRGYLKNVSVTHATVIATALATMGLVKPQSFSVAGFKLFTIEAIETHKLNGNFVDDFLKSVSYFYETGYKCFEERSLMPILVSTDEITNVTIMVTELVSNIQSFMLGNCLDEEQFELDMGVVEHKLRTLKLVHTQGFMAKEISALTHKFAKVQEEFIAFQKSQVARVRPFSVKIHGPSGVGKTTICNVTTNVVLYKNGFSCADKDIVTVDANSKFDSTMRSNASCYVLDDLANATPTTAVRNVADVIIRTINNAPATANMSESKEKGKVLIQPKLVVVTTNNETLDASFWTVNEKSVLRRFNVHISVTSRPQYSCAQGMLLPGLKSEEPLPDYWSIHVKEPVFKGERFLHWRTVVAPDIAGLRKLSVIPGTPMNDISVDDYTRYINYLSEKHYEDQKDVVARLREPLGGLKMCEKCRNCQNYCECDPDPSQAEFQSLISRTAIVKTFAPMIFASLWASVQKTVGHVVDDVADAIVPSRAEALTLKSRSTIALLTRWMGFRRYSIRTLCGLLPYSWAAHPFGKAAHKWLMRHEVAGDARRTTLCMGLLLLVIKRYVPRMPWWAIPGTLIPIHQIANYAHECALDRELSTRGNLTDMRYTYVKQRAIDLAKRVKETTVRPELSGAFGVAIVAAAFAMRGIFSRTIESHPFQGNLAPASLADLEERDTEVCMWTSIDSRDTIVGSTQTGEQLQALTEKNHVNITVLDDEGKPLTACGGFFIKTHWLLVPYHLVSTPLQDGPYIIRDVTTIRILRAPPYKDGVQMHGASYVTKIYASQIHRIALTDIAMVHISSGGDFRDMTRYLPETYAAHDGQFCSSVRKLTGLIQQNFGTFKAKKIDTHTRSEISFDFFGGYSMPRNTWNDGDCMATIVSQTTDPKIIGFHVRGFATAPSLFTSPHGIFCIITNGLLADTIADYEQKWSVMNASFQAKSVPKRSFGQEIKFLDSTYKGNCLTKTPDIKFRVLGTLDSPKTYRTDYVSSKAFEQVVAEFGPPKSRPTPFNPREAQQPFKDWMKKINNQMHNLDTVLLSHAQNDWLSVMYNFVDLHVSDGTMKPLDENSIIGGLQGKRFIDSMNMKAAAGFPFSGKKSTLVEKDQHGIWHFKDPNIMLHIAVLERWYLEGVSPGFIFKACQKDEIVPRWKNGILNEKVRVFQAAPLDAQILIRKYFLPLIRLVSFHPLDSECAVGINCFSPEYDQLNDHMTYFGDKRMVCGDYSGWDQMLSPQLVLAAFNVLIAIAQRCPGYTPEHITIMKGIAHDTAYPMVTVGGVLVQMLGGNPSGQNLTAHINSICNSLLLRCVAFSLSKKPFDFRANIRLITYGDDMLANVRKNVQFGFNEVRVRLDSWNVKFTTDTKDDSEIRDDYIHVDNTTFLKRRANFIPEIQCTIGALDPESIIKSLYFYKPSLAGYKNVLASILGAASVESFAHGREFYENIHVKLIRIAESQAIHVPELHYSFDERATRWRIKYRGEKPQVPPEEKCALGVEDALDNLDGYQDQETSQASELLLTVPDDQSSSAIEVSMTDKLKK